MPEENFIQDLDKKRRMLYAGGIGCVILAAAIFYLMFYFATNPGPAESEIIPEKTENTQVSKRVYNVNPRTEGDCNAISDEYDKQKCLDELILDAAIDEGDFKKCSLIQLEDMRIDCMQYIARNKRSVDLCLQIPNDKKKEVCITDIAISSKDPAICLTAFSESFERRECMDVTNAFKISESGRADDIKECEKLETKEYANLCLIQSYDTKYGSECEKVPEQFRQHCIDNKAMQSARKEEDCNVVSDPNYKDLCLKIAKYGITEAGEFDSDRDGINDGNEIFMKTEPKNSDTDGDGLGDGEEWLVYGTDPGAADTDADGLNDKEEVKKYSTNPKNPDTDGDGRNDYNEIKERRNATQPD